MAQCSACGRESGWEWELIGPRPLTRGGPSAGSVLCSLSEGNSLLTRC
jgi:hypothetical protein